MTATPTTDSTRVAVVDDTYHWRKIDGNTPRGSKLQLINRGAGVATYGTLGTDPGHWTHWAPLPTFAADDVRHPFGPKPAAPVSNRLPSDDTEGGAV